MGISVILGLGPQRWVEAAGGPGTTAERTFLIGYRDREESIADGMRQPEDLDSPPHLHPIEAVRADGAGATGRRLPGRWPPTAPSGSTSTSTSSTRRSSRRRTT